MTKKAGQSNTVFSKAKKLRQAIKYFTGGEHIINEDASGWKELQHKIETQGNTVFEFCYFISEIYCLSFDRRPSPAVLTRQAFMLSDKVQDSFAEYMRCRKNEVSILSKNHRKLLLDEIRLFNRDIHEVLLDDDLKVNPCIRCDIALQKLEDPEEVLDKYISSAGYIMLGNPEFAHNCLYLKNHFLNTGFITKEQLNL